MILVTGGTGFLGSTLLQQLTEQGKNVIALKRESSHVPEKLLSSPLISWVNGDLTDYFTLAEIIPSVRQVYHCGAKVSFQSSETQSLLQTNIEGTRHIVDLCLIHGVRLVHVSSVAALGISKVGAAVKESDLWEKQPKTSIYSLSKYESEMEVWRGIAEGLDAVIVNPSVIIGLGPDVHGSRAIFDLVHKGNRLYPQGSIGLVDVEDVARVMIMLMEKGTSGERFILNSENISNHDLLRKISQVMDKPQPKIKASKLLLSIAWRLAKLGAIFNGKQPALTAETARAANRKLCYDNSKITSLLGYTFKPIDQSIKEICRTYY